MSTILSTSTSKKQQKSEQQRSQKRFRQFFLTTRSAKNALNEATTKQFYIVVTNVLNDLNTLLPFKCFINSNVSHFAHKLQTKDFRQHIHFRLSGLIREILHLCQQSWAWFSPQQCVWGKHWLLKLFHLMKKRRVVHAALYVQQDIFKLWISQEALAETF